MKVDCKKHLLGLILQKARLASKYNPGLFPICPGFTHDVSFENEISI